VDTDSPLLHGDVHLLVGHVSNRERRAEILDPDVARGHDERALGVVRHLEPGAAGAKHESTPAPIRHRFEDRLRR
jgi:hypothetical protein